MYPTSDYIGLPTQLSGSFNELPQEFAIINHPLAPGKKAVARFVITNTGPGGAASPQYLVQYRVGGVGAVLSGYLDAATGTITPVLGGTTIPVGSGPTQAALVFATSNTQAQATTGPALVTIPFRPQQAVIAAGFVMPSVGNSVTVTVASSTGFIAGDVVIAYEFSASGAPSKAAWFTVTPITGTSVSLTAIAQPGQPSAGTAFAANATELIGQTRLPTAPSGAVRAEITGTLSSDALALVGGSGPISALANDLAGGRPFCYYRLKAGTTGDIDLKTSMGRELRTGFSVVLDNAANMTAFRLVGAAPLALAAMLEVEYS